MIWLTTFSLAWATPVTPVAGLEWTPFSRADAVWVEDGRTTGSGVGEFDGVVRPQLAAFGGVWFDHRWGLTANIGLARLQQTTWTGDVFVQKHWAVIRPALDLRISLLKRTKPIPIPWILIGGHFNIPSAKEISNGFTEEENEQAELNGLVNRVRLGGAGARLGMGVDYGITKYTRIGFQFYGEWHRMIQKSSEAQLVNSWIGSQAALYLAFEWPSKQD